MCGRNKKCLECSRISGVKKRKSIMANRRKGGLTGQLVNVAIAGAGFILADQINKLPFISSNPQMGNFVKLGIGTYLAMTGKSPMIVSAAQGMALNGAIGAARQYGIVSGIGQIALPWNGNYGQNSAAIPGVAGKVLIQ